MTDYGRMDPDALVEHLIDEGGLVIYLDTQMRGIPRPEWDWHELTLQLYTFSRGRLTFSPGYLADLYEMQRQRRDEE